MKSKLDDALHQVLQNANKHSQHNLIPVIVTYKPGSDLTEFEKYGLIIHNIFEAIHALSGEISTSVITKFLNLPAVVKVEYDDPDGVRIQDD